MLRDGCNMHEADIAGQFRLYHDDKIEPRGISVLRIRCIGYRVSGGKLYTVLCCFAWLELLSLHQSPEPCNVDKCCDVCFEGLSTKKPISSSLCHHKACRNC